MTNWKKIWRRAIITLWSMILIRIPFFFVQWLCFWIGQTKFNFRTRFGMPMSIYISFVSRLLRSVFGWNSDIFALQDNSYFVKWDFCWWRLLNFFILKLTSVVSFFFYRKYISSILFLLKAWSPFLPFTSIWNGLISHSFLRSNSFFYIIWINITIVLNCSINLNCFYVFVVWR